MINAPFLIFFIGAIIAMALPNPQRKWLMLATPIVGLLNLIWLDHNALWQVTVFSTDLILVSTDRLSFIFGILFHIAAIIAVIYAWHVNDRPQQAAALLYPGSALGVVFAGDFLTLFIFWECLAITSVFFITARKTAHATKAAIRYLIFQVLSGVLMLTAILYLFSASNDLTLRAIDIHSPGAILLLLAIGIKAGFPLLHNWITDAYPEATVAGCVFLSAFTTKVAVYVLARTFSGLEILIYIGAIMACFPIFYAVIENDLRRVLGYSMINQIGFMVCGIGIGTELAVNGAVAHAFNDVIFKGLLMMSMGAVLFRTGEMRGSHLGGLARYMPKTMVLCIIGAASISAFPLFSGFVSKSMVLAALLIENQDIVWLMMLFASAGVFHHAGIKIPYFAFFAHASDKRPQEAPTHMLIAMSLAAGLCIFIGVYPYLLYEYLPYHSDYSPFHFPHVVEQIQLLFFSALAFVWLQLKNIYPPELKSTNIDSDWFYRRFFPRCYQAISASTSHAQKQLYHRVAMTYNVLTPYARRYLFSLIMPWDIKQMGFIVMLMSILVLLVFYIFI